MMMLNELNYSRFYKIYKKCTEDVKGYKENKNVSLSQAPINKLHNPAICEFERITSEKVNCSFDHLLKHRISLYCKLCNKCGNRE